MAEPTIDLEDLEDGEIESDGEETSEVKTDETQSEKPSDDKPSSDLLEQQEDVFYTKPGKKKKSKSGKGEHRNKDKERKRNRRYTSPTEEDFACNIEKAIRKAMNRNGEHGEDDMEERRRSKKRKKQDVKDGSGKKRRRHDMPEEVDESEMMCVRGASPVQQLTDENDLHDRDEGDSYDSESSHDSRHHRPRHRPAQRERDRDRDRNKSNKNERRRNGHPMQDPDGICLYYMQGKCHKGDDCIYSHDALPPRKMELCKFYLMDCCAKRDKCLYMHADFPCKYYHTGLPCVFKDECKFAHGKPLTDNLKNILLKHIESAPKEILGDFPRLNREGAMKMIQTTQMKLMQQFSDNFEGQEKNIPSLFELNIPNPQNMDPSLQYNQFMSDKQNKHSPKVRQSRWQNEMCNPNVLNISPTSNSGGANVLSIKNLTGVLSPKQISDLTKMGIENLDQLGQLTVLQLNSIGLSLKQITEIQLNTMNIQKLGLINPHEQQASMVNSMAASKDLDLRVPPGMPNNIPAVTEILGKDVDMRFQPSVPSAETLPKPNIKDTKHKDMIDIDQYTKDALKFALKDNVKENVDVSNECVNDDKSIPLHETKDVDQRVLPFSKENTSRVLPSNEDNVMKKESDTDIRFLQPDPIFKSPEKRRHRLSTTDDEDNNLLIDEKWYSSDEEKGTTRHKKSPASSPRTTLQAAPEPHVIPSATMLSKLGDLSKIDISEEVTKLLNTMKNNLHENPITNTPRDRDRKSSEEKSPPRSRDPRSRRSPDKASESKRVKRAPKVSIYECIEGEPTDGRRRADVDLRSDFKMPAFGDLDLRQSTSGDIDFRLGLPFKAIPNYTPASEIDGSINSHPPITYKLVPIHIPRPDYTDIKNSTAKSQALHDPRLRKVFRLSLEDSGSDTEKPIKPPVAVVPRVDPRRKPKEESQDEAKNNSLDLQTVLQNSSWYRELSTTQKIFVNQNLAPVTQAVKQFHQEKASGKKFDLAAIHGNAMLGSIFTNLGISLGENGEFSYLPKPKEPLLKNPPINFGPNGNPYMGMGPNVDGMMNMGMGYNQNFADPRGGPQPGLLGMAPNMPPHNFPMGPNNFGNMGPMQGGFMDGFRGGPRGRGGERWHRGGPNRGQGRNRGNWNNDRN